MEDLREDFLKEVMIALTKCVSEEQIDNVQNTIIDKLQYYNMTRNEEVVKEVATDSKVLIDMFLSTKMIQGKSKNSIHTYKNVLLRFAKDVRKPLIDVGVFDIKVWFVNLQNDNVTLRTISNYRSYLSAFYGFLFREKMITYNPMDCIQAIKFKENDEEAYSQIEIESLRNSCTDYKERAIVELLLSSGIRVSELCGVKIEDLRNDSMLFINHGKGG